MLAPGSAAATADPLLLHCWGAEGEGLLRQQLKKYSMTGFFVFFNQ